MLFAVVASAAVLAGSSVQDRPINAVETGDGARALLVVGSIHGNETAGHAVVRALRDMAPDGVRVVTVASANPDGVAASTRQNARGVDLNRNWPHRWRGGGRPFDTYYPGPRRASEPETRVLRRLIRRVRPDVTLWYHQRLALVTLLPRADNDIIRAYGARVGLPAKRLPHYRGTAVSWQNKTFKRASAFVVELPDGSLSRKQARRHARAALATVGPDAEAAAKRPRIVQDPIPFGKARKRQMRAYSKRHYGVRAHRLEEVKTIVEHYTANDSYSATYNTFAANAPDVEFGERPGVCAHFVIDQAGVIHQQVPLALRCRHTVGLNDRSIGIEHVGTSDAAVMGNKKMLRASLKLTRWLQGEYGVPTKHVIGHSESLSSPFHHENVAAMRKRTHGDMQPATMKRYRKKL